MSHEHACPSCDNAPLFSEAELADMRDDDRKAGRDIVLVMTGIFFMGLVGYGLVDLWVHSS